MKNTIDLSGYTWPFEGEEHKGTIILLPYRNDTWTNSGKEAIEVFLELVKIISNHETVYLGVSSKLLQSYVERFKLPNVVILYVEYNDAWARDNTLIFLNDGKKHLAVDFGFNAWGGSVDGLYTEYEEDNALGGILADYFGIEVVSCKDFILEGGSIHTDGKGTILTTKACLLSEGRNPKFTKKEIEDYILKYLNAERIIWLEHGIVEDETNEHVDNMCCFLDQHTIALAWSDDSTDLQHKYSQDCFDVLSKTMAFDGKPYKIVKLPCPSPVLRLTELEANQIVQDDTVKPRKAKDRLAASYINFYQGKDFVVVPQFGVKEDEIALKTLKEFYKNKKVYPLNSRAILVGGGNIHCITMQIGGIFDNEKC